MYYSLGCCQNSRDLNEKNDNPLLNHKPIIIELAENELFTGEKIKKFLNCIIENKFNKNSNVNFTYTDIDIIDLSYRKQIVDIVDHTKSYILSLMANTLIEAATIIYDIFNNLMINKSIVKRCSFSKRNKKVGAKTFHNFLIKIYLGDIEFKDVNFDFLSNYEIKLKVDDKKINFDDKTEIGIKQNNWKIIQNPKK